MHVEVLPGLVPQCSIRHAEVGCEQCVTDIILSVSEIVAKKMNRIMKPMLISQQPMIVYFRSLHYTTIVYSKITHAVKFNIVTSGIQIFTYIDNIQFVNNVRISTKNT